MPWTVLSDATDPSWTAVNSTTSLAWPAGAAPDTNPWYQLSASTRYSTIGDVDFELVADEQYPWLTYEDPRAQLVVESGYTTTP